MFRTLSLLLLAGLLSACSSVQVTQDYDKQADLAALKTYAWVPEPPKETGDPRIDNPLQHERIRAAIDSTLAEKGFTQVDGADADFLVAYHIAVRSRVEYQRSSVTIGTGYYTGRSGVGIALDYPYGAREYDEGSLLIDFLAPADRKLLWRGSGVRPVSETPDPAKRDEITTDVVQRILKQFPPQK